MNNNISTNNSENAQDNINIQNNNININNNDNNNIQNNIEINQNIPDIQNNNNGNNNNMHISIINIPGLTITFILILSINIIIYLYSKIFLLDTSSFIFQYNPIVSKYQLYRMITRYFIHFGIAHLILEQSFFFYLCKYSEGKLGTLITLSLIFASMILDSIINIILIPFFSLFSSYRLSVYLNHAYEGGLTPVLFSIVTYFSFFEKNRNERFFFENFFYFRMKHPFIYMLGILYFFTPNRTFYGNVAGIIGGILIKNFRGFFLPRLKDVYDFEISFGLYKVKSLYKSININNAEMKNIMTEYDRDSLYDIEAI